MSSRLPAIRESPSPTTSPAAKNVKWLSPENSPKRADYSSPKTRKNNAAAMTSTSADTDSVPDLDSSDDEEEENEQQMKKSPTVVDASLQFGCVKYVRPQDIKRRVSPHMTL
jgi:hypothetical protein